MIAVDGTTLRGSAAGGEDGRHLPAALDHARGVVLGQAGAGATTGEIPMLPALLDRSAVGGAVITAGARHAQREHARYLARRGAHNILTVQGGQPGACARLKALPWRQVPVTSDTRGRGHGRREHRTLKVTAVAGGWPSRTPPRRSRSSAAGRRPGRGRSGTGPPRPSARSPR